MGNDAQSIIAPRKIIYHMQLLDDESLVSEFTWMKRALLFLILYFNLLLGQRIMLPKGST